MVAYSGYLQWIPARGRDDSGFSIGVYANAWDTVNSLGDSVFNEIGYGSIPCSDLSHKPFDGINPDSSVTSTGMTVG